MGGRQCGVPGLRLAFSCLRFGWLIDLLLPPSPTPRLPARSQLDNGLS